MRWVPVDFERLLRKVSHSACKKKVKYYFALVWQLKNIGNDTKYVFTPSHR